MSNKKQTPVSWLVSELIEYNLMHKDVLPSHPIFEKALEMESKKQQKYDEMLEMLKEFEIMCDKLQFPTETNLREMRNKARNLIKEAKEL